MNIAFVDHPSHRQTRSSHFFAALLAPLGPVEFFYPGADWRLVIEKIIQRRFDLVICWQHEFYAPPFVAAGLRVIAVPMYDGSGGLSDGYWGALRQVPLINFSTGLHHRVSRLGLRSLSVRFFPDPPAETCLPFNHLRAFLWTRNTLVTWRLLKKLTRHQLSSLHLHLALDDASPCEPSSQELDDLREAFPDLTLSRWFENKADFRAALLRCNIFFAPRLREGIGMPVLEAMSHGMCVIAHRLPTTNEYITDGYDGLLCDYLNPGYVSLAEAAHVGANARQTLIQGRSGWVADQQAIIRYISEVMAAPAPAPSPADKARLNAFPERYWCGSAR